MDEKLRELYAACRLCPRRCGVNRLARQTGACHAAAECYIARAALHYWEEPCLSGTEGSGTVFFSGCGLGCIYCQNTQIRSEMRGQIYTPEELAETFLRLQEEGANNINLVTACHFLPHVIAALRLVRGQKLTIPVVYNSGGYESVESLRMLEGLVDVYLPDLKYLSPQRAQKYSHAADYPDTAKAAIAEMVRQQPEAVFDSRGRMLEGVIVRHLVLPGGREDSLAVIRYLHETYGDRIYMSLMNQYTPVLQDPAYPELLRKLHRREYERILDEAVRLGVENAYIQAGGTAKESFIPPFDGK